MSQQLGHMSYVLLGAERNQVNDQVKDFPTILFIYFLTLKGNIWVFFLCCWRGNFAETWQPCAPES